MWYAFLKKTYHIVETTFIHIVYSKDFYIFKAVTVLKHLIYDKHQNIITRWHKKITKCLLVCEVRPNKLGSKPHHPKPKVRSMNHLVFSYYLFMFTQCPDTKLSFLYVTHTFQHGTRCLGYYCNLCTHTACLGLTTASFNCNKIQMYCGIVYLIEKKSRQDWYT